MRALRDGTYMIIHPKGSLANRHTPWINQDAPSPESQDVYEFDENDPEEVEYHRLLEECVEKKLIGGKGGRKMFIKDGSEWRMRTFSELRSLLAKA